MAVLRVPSDHGVERSQSQSCRDVTLAVKQWLSLIEVVSQIAKIAGMAGVGVRDDPELSVVLGVQAGAVG